MGFMTLLGERCRDLSSTRGVSIDPVLEWLSQNPQTNLGCVQKTAGNIISLH